MANKKASKKSIRQNEAKKLLNKAALSRIKTERRKFLEALSKGSNFAFDQFSVTQSLLAKAAKTHLIHWKKAARLTSRMSQKLSVLSAAKAVQNN